MREKKEGGEGRRRGRGGEGATAIHHFAYSTFIDSSIIRKGEFRWRWEGGRGEIGGSRGVSGFRDGNYDRAWD